METTPAPNKVKITSELIKEWTHDAAVLLDANCSDREIIHDLRERGCTPRMAEQIVTNAKGPVRARHRMYGIYSMLIGVVMLLLGWWLMRYLGGSYRISPKGWVSVAGLLVGGGAVALLGVYKFLTGSAVDVQNSVLGTADDELNMARVPVASRKVDSMISAADVQSAVLNSADDAMKMARGAPAGRKMDSR